MNMKWTMAFAAALMAASASLAQASEYQDFSNVVSTRSRAEVIAELAAARANGDKLEVRDTTYPDLTQPFGMRRSRQEVLDELSQFRAEHPHFISDLEYPSAFQSSTMRQGMASTRTTVMAK